MKKSILLLLFVVLGSYAANDGLSDARALAEQGIIVNQSMASPTYGISPTSDIQEASMYRLSDTIIRQEVLGIALKLKGVQLPNQYSCRNYYRDTTEWWVCRAAELSADQGFITRANLHFRPHDTLTLAEALGISLQSLDIALSSSSISAIPDTLPDWQKRLILTLQENRISLNVVDDNGKGIALYDPRIGSTASGFDMSHRLTRGQFFQILTVLLDYRDNLNPTAHCSVYNDGCNDCTRVNGVSTCTERACFWQGIPSCSQCEAGYTLNNNRCIKQETACIAEGEYAGGGFVMYPENLENFQCCSGLTRAERKDGSTLADAGYTCIRQGDNYCDARYESDYNSSDCRIGSCKKIGEAVSNFSLPPEYQFSGVCCSGLTSVPPQEGGVGGSNICAQLGDGICDARYESKYNSSDCGLEAGTFDASICQSYYDGCNSCSRTENGQTICTLRACFVNGPAYCTTYAPYVPKNQIEDSVFIAKSVSEMRNYTKDLSCTINAQCQWSMVGYKACGGPSAAIAFSTKNVDTDLIASKDTYITNAEKKWNETYGIMSDCMYVQPPQEMRCINGLCQ